MLTLHVHVHWQLGIHSLRCQHFYKMLVLAGICLLQSSGTSNANADVSHTSSCSRLHSSHAWPRYTMLAAQAYSEAVVMTGMTSSCFLYVSAAAWISTLGPFCVGIEGLANDTVTSPCMGRSQESM